MIPYKIVRFDLFLSEKSLTKSTFLRDAADLLVPVVTDLIVLAWLRPCAGERFSGHEW
ncbi:hypothetical protein MKY25_02535 [Geobacillus sp. FSL W8-0032]|uniref:Uncharacterized protein n=1 Tax=Geobacillus icigianus TaxID=1430331 RepID=A0ABU6BJZ6_9BACL|nr:hypothetical protein [Geobacillus sp. B4113_201601]KYD28021.1 hypothetical protein B4113_4098 [Geobacillus sp. B4113_201601]MEB3752014.1 hypothetical protein [Geobacillus icigianus]